MALSGLHVTFGHAGARGAKMSDTNTVQSLFRIIDSETIATAGTSTKSAQDFDSGFGEPVIRVIASADSFVSFGSNPNATTGPRDFVPALEARDYVVKFGDKVAWVAA